MTQKALTPEQLSIREKFIVSPAAKTELVEYNGAQLEVRQPTLAVRNAVNRQARIDLDRDQLEDDDDEKSEKKSKATKGKKVTVNFDLGRMQIGAVIACTYFPGTDVKVFNDIDAPILESALAGGGIDLLIAAAMRMLNVKASVIAKNSEPTPT